ncbi:MAG: hypothetical protein ABGX69_06620 [Methylococcales bacterium]|nr:hypothetical protein [Methylococcaceae bacterium]
MIAISSTTPIGVGFFYRYLQTGPYERTGFIATKFKIKLQDDRTMTIDNPELERGNGLYLCSPP